jgi:hypothetical protein
MKYFFTLLVLSFVLFAPKSILAANVGFSISPNTVPGDNAVILDVFITPDDSESINALEGRIGILGEGAEAVTEVVVESGDSVFSMWPVSPEYEEAGRIIRFTGGSPVSINESGKILSLRIFTDEKKPLTVSWLGGSAYLDDGFGTPAGISSRSINFTPQSGAPNQIRSTSEDVKPPYINSIEISSAADLYEGKSFLSVYATDDITGISHYEVNENGNVTRVENGLYLIKDQSMENPLHVTVYDKAGNSISIRYPEEKSNILKLPALILAVLMLLIIIFRYFKMIVR